jgi:predicted Zn-dependent protease
VAYASLGRVYGDIGESALSAENTSKAYILRQRASDEERFFITASYDTQVTGNLQRAEQTCKLWAEAYPRDPSPHGLLAGIVYAPLGRYEESLEEAKRMIELQPDFFVGYDILTFSNLALGRTADAENTLRQAEQRRFQSPFSSLYRYQIGFLNGNKEAMKKQAEQAQGKPGLDDWIADAESQSLAYSGHLLQAREKSQHARDFALQSGHRDEAAIDEVHAALREALFGNVAAAEHRATAAVELSKSRDVQYGTAFAFALAGEYRRSETMSDNLARQFPQDTIVNFVYLPTLRALVAFGKGKGVQAIELLRATTPYELGGGASLYPAYVRGESYLEVGQGVQATTEFEKILGHRGIVVFDPIGALTHLQLGRAYAMSGDTAKAKAAYQDFLTLWKDADPDIPVLKQAKTEYAKLQ